MDFLQASMCIVPGCRNLRRRKNGQYCNRHEIQMRRHGKITDKPAIESLQGEIWKDIKGYNGLYKISNKGRVLSLQKTPIILKPIISKRKAPHVALGSNDKNRTCVSALVLDTFKPANPYLDKTIVYLDGDKTNCGADNLEWYGVYWRDKSMECLTARAASGCKDAIDITAYMNGDIDSITGFISRHKQNLESSVVWRLTRRGLGISHINKDDICQDTFIKALYAIKAGRLRNTENIKGWLSRIAGNVTIQYLRAYKGFVSENYTHDSGNTTNYIDHAIFEGMIDNGFYAEVR